MKKFNISLKGSRTSFGTLMKYCKEKHNAFDGKSVSKAELNNILKKFYVEVRKGDGDLYKKSSLCKLRFGIQRQLKQIRYQYYR